MNNLARMLVQCAVLTLTCRCVHARIADEVNRAWGHKRYNEVCFATSHNGQSHKKSFVSNQDVPLKEQLEAGIRAVKIPVWYGIDRHGKRSAYACHGMSKTLLHRAFQDELICKIPRILRHRVAKLIENFDPLVEAIRKAIDLSYGHCDNEQGIIQFPHYLFDPASRPLQDVCDEIKSFLDVHLEAVVTLILEDFTDNLAIINEALELSGLRSYAHVQDKEKAWPTLSTMIITGKRLVTFVATQDERSYSLYPWLHPLWDYAWDTQFTFRNIRDFNNDRVPNRGKEAYETRNVDPRNKLFIVYHFITPCVGGSVSQARRANRARIIKRRLTRLEKMTGHIPNFVQVDFFEYPHNDTLNVIDSLNKAHAGSRGI